MESSTTCDPALLAATYSDIATRLAGIQHTQELKYIRKTQNLIWTILMSWLNLGIPSILVHYRSIFSIVDKHAPHVATQISTRARG
jgi:hypothetical protein